MLIIYLFLNLTAIFISLFVLFKCLKEVLTQQYSKYLSFLMLINILYSASTLLSIVTKDNHTKIIATYFLYSMGSLLALTLYAFSTKLYLTKVKREVNQRNIYLIAILLTLFNHVLWTNHIHHTFIQEFIFVKSGMFTIIRPVLGPFFYIFMITTLAIFIFSNATISISFSLLPFKRASKFLIIVIMFFIPVVIFILFATNLLKWDFITLSVSIAGILLYKIQIHYRILSIIPLGKNEVIENMDDSLIILDSFYNILDINPSALNLLNVKVNNVIHKSIYDVLKDWPEILNELENKSSSYGKRFKRQFDSDEEWFLVKCSEILYNDNSLGKFIIIRDITELEQQIESLYNAKKKLDKANNSKNIFLANLSHELRTPMNSIIGMTELLNLTKLNEIQHSKVKELLHTSNNLLYLINKILDLSKIEAGQMKLDINKMDLNNLIDNFKQWYKNNTEKEVIINTPSDVPFLMTDETRLLTILISICDLYICFSEKIVVNFQYIEQENQYIIIEFISSLTTDQKLILKQVIERKSIEENKVLSLAKLNFELVENLVSLFNGKISFIDNNLIVSIPVKKVLNQKKLSTNTLMKNDKILVAEDNIANQKLITLQLAKLGYVCVTVSDGKEALDEVFKNDYKLVFMDCHMPVMNGFEAAKLIREKESELGLNPSFIIALTASDLKEDIEKCFKSGMDAFLSKPLTLDKLRTIIDNYFKEDK